MAVNAGAGADAGAAAGAAAGVAVVVFVVNMTGKNEIPLFVVLLAFESKRTERLLKWFFDELFIFFSPVSFTSDTCIYIFFTYMYERDETSASVPPRVIIEFDSQAQERLKK
ncbi:hypothetical protein EDC94DRAFT_651019 [Helicostylum pulchrum]|nr:hypothetical protein EDC94DRAFT_651019 [Helicostylum pulchrum]